MKSNLSPFLMISAMKLQLLCFSSVHSNILMFLLSKFSTSENRTSMGKIKLQSLRFPILTFSTSSMFSCMSVLHDCLCTPCIDFDIKFPFWLKVSFIYSKSFSLSLDIINQCIYVITKKPL